MKKRIAVVSVFLLALFGFVTIVKADVYSSYGLLLGATHVSDPTNLGKNYPKYWYNGINYQNEFTLSLNKQENGLYILKTTRYPVHQTGEHHIKFDGYGPGSYKVVITASGGNIFAEYLLYSGDTYDATNIEEAM